MNTWTSIWVMFAACVWTFIGAIIVTWALGIGAFNIRVNGKMYTIENLGPSPEGQK
jgi:hypothetical protein